MKNKPALFENTAPTAYWHALPDGRIECTLCPRHCRLQEGQRGLCFARARQDGAVVLTGYGLCSGLAVDPIEKKPLYHFLPGSSILSFGTLGCNLACRFCQNWHISKAKGPQAAGRLVKALPGQIAGAALENGCASVAFTYNEPIIFMEYACDTADACRKKGLKTVAVTAGYICEEPRKKFFDHMDAVNVDLKAFTDDFYRKLCGARLQPVLDTLLYIRKKTKVWLEVTTLLIPGKNDSPEETDALTRWVKDELGEDVPLHFSAFFPAFRLDDVPATGPAVVTRAREIGMKNGLKYVYTGNIRDKEGGTTLCASCKKPLIERRGFEVLSTFLDGKGRCRHCGATCPGLFSSPG